MGACQPQTGIQSPAQAPLLPTPSETDAPPEFYLTAREGLPQAQQLAQSRLKNAQLTYISGQWIDQNGRSREWSYVFVESESQQEIWISKDLITLQQALAEDTPTQPIDQIHWDFDSPAALLLLSTRQQLAYPIQSLQLDAELIWQVESSDTAWQVEAHRRAPVPGAKMIP